MIRRSSVTLSFIPILKTPDPFDLVAAILNRAEVILQEPVRVQTNLPGLAVRLGTCVDRIRGLMGSSAQVTAILRCTPSLRPLWRFFGYHPSYKRLDQVTESVVF